MSMIRDPCATKSPDNLDISEGQGWAHGCSKDRDLDRGTAGGVAICVIEECAFCRVVDEP